MSIQTTKKDIIWSYVGIITSMGTNFAILPFLIKYLSSDMLGLWYVYLSIGGIVILFDFGFNPTFARNIAYCWSGAKSLERQGVVFSESQGPNYELLTKVIAICEKLYLRIALVALIILAIPGTLYVFRISGNLFNSTILISWFIYVLAVVANLYYGYYATLLRGVGAISDYNKANVIARIIQISTSITLLMLGFGIIGVSLAYLLNGMFIRLISRNKFYSYSNMKCKLKNYTSFEDVELKTIFFNIFSNAKKDGVVFVSNYLAGQCSTLVCSTYLTLSQTGAYSIAVQLATAIATIAAALFTAYLPSFQSLYINNNIEQTKKMLSSSMVIYTVLYWLGFVVLMCVGIPFIKWIKPSAILESSIIATVFVYEFLYKRHSYYASYISCTNSIPYVTSYIISSIGGLALSIILIRAFDLEIWGLILGQLIIQLAYNNWKWPQYVRNMLGISEFEFIKTGIQFSGEILRKFSLTLNRK